MSNQLPTVGIVGVGTMGSAIAEVLRPRHRLVVYDTDAAAAERQRAAGAHRSASPAELADQAELVLLSLPGPDEVDAAVTGPQGLLSTLHPPRVIADLSTVDPDTTRDLATTAADHDVGYLDAPVLGRPHRCGAWTLPVGGREQDLARALPTLNQLASRVIRVGDHGAGNIVKLLNNLMFGAINAITAETMAAAKRLGLDPATYYTTIADSGAATVSNLFNEIAPKIVAEDWAPAFTIDLLAKDNRLALAMAEQAGLNLAVAKAVLQFDEAGITAGLGSLDTSALTRLVE